MSGDKEEHRSFEDFAVRHVMGSLDEVESGAFRSHLLDCLECRARVGELRSIASDLAEVERVERRERAAQRVETKQREAQPPPDTTAISVPPPRGGRVLVVVGVLLIVLMSIWNFVLRGQNEGLRDLVAAHARSAEAINFGDPWVTMDTATGHEGIARSLNGRLAVLISGTDDDVTYRISLFDAEGHRIGIRTDSEVSMDGQVRWFGGPLPAEVVRVDVTLDRTNDQSLIFRAAAP
ncbi:MAG TPA: hypothetical protein VMM13_12835 [Euzebya sp.]|nr:hypothetical protein [Euzebya sp.]